MGLELVLSIYGQQNQPATIAFCKKVLFLKCIWKQISDSMEKEGYFCF
jgi:hypothetical protein